MKNLIGALLLFLSAQSFADTASKLPKRTPSSDINGHISFEALGGATKALLIKGEVSKVLYDALDKTGPAYGPNTIRKVGESYECTLFQSELEYMCTIYIPDTKKGVAKSQDGLREYLK